MMPLPLPLVLPSSSHRVVSGSRIRTDDLAFVRLGETSRAEVTQRFGAPWADYTDLHVTVYYWETLRGWIGPIGGGAGEELTRLDVLFIRFDEEDRVKSYRIMKHPSRITTQELAARWVSSK
jgi:hypothetical protein